jgi:hypothetical protein
MKHLKHTLATRACNIRGRKRAQGAAGEARSGLATPDLVMSRAEVEHRGSASIDSGHNLLVGNNDIGSTLTRRGTRHGATRRSGHGVDGARRSDRCDAARCGMGAPPRDGLGWADCTVSRDEREVRSWGFLSVVAV